MSGFVTAPKVWLSILIKMYCSGLVQEEDHANYLPFITSHLLPGLVLGKSGRSVFQVEQLTLDTIRIQLEPLLAKADSPSRNSNGNCTLWLTFVFQVCKVVHLDELGKALCHIDDVVMRADRAAESLRLKACTLAPNSLFGAFLTRLQLSWDQMLFETQMKLWSDFAEHRAILIEEYAAELNGNMLTMAIASEMQRESNTNLEQSLYGLILRHNQNQAASVIADEDLEAMLHFQTEQMEKYGARLDQDTQRILQDILSTARTASAASHYFSFLSSWHAGDYYSALDNLHRHFDYTMPDQSQSRYPYACLNMAVLQADFGCYEEALPAIAEAINAARELSDHNCLAFCLSWLHHFRLIDHSEETQSLANKMLGTDDAGLTYLRQQAKKYELWSLESSILASQTKAAIARGSRPLESFELLHESSALNLKYDLPSVSGEVLLLKSSLYAGLGLQDMSDAYIDLIDFWYAPVIPVAQRVNVHSSRACECLSRGDSAGVDQYLAAARRDAANNIKHMQVVTIYTNLIKLKQAILLDDFFEAEIILYTLKSAPSIDPTITWAIYLEEVSFYTRSRNFSKAFKLIENHLASIGDAPMGPSASVQLRIRLLNGKARVFTAAGRPPKALSIVLRAAAAAQKAKAVVLFWESMALLMQVLCSLEQYNVAKDIGHMYVEQVRATKDLTLLAEMQMWLAEAHLGLAREIDGFTKPREQEGMRTQDERNTMLNEAKSRANDSVAAAKKLGDEQLATRANETLGKIEERLAQS